MEYLDQILRENMVIVTFVYGLTFFLIGLAITLKYIKDSNFKLAGSLRLLAGFGIVHGLAEWGDIFIPLQANHISSSTAFVLRTGQMVMDALSFSLLISFFVELGVKTWLHKERPLNRFLPEIIAGAGFAAWLILVITDYRTFGQPEPQHWLLHGGILARYILGFPGALGSGLVLLAQRPELRRLGSNETMRNLTGVSVSMILYAVAAGLIVPSEHFVLAGLINTTWFFATFRIPVQILRTICGLGILYFVIGLLRVFDLERHKLLEQAQKNQAVLQERERIALDLHDGIIQSIYAIGLNIENSIYLVQENPGQAQDSLAEVMKKLNAIINEIRAYVLNLRPLQLQGLGLDHRLYDLVNEFKANSLISVNFSLPDDSSLAGLTPVQVEHLFHITREALSNVLRHAEASEVEVQLQSDHHTVCLRVKDNGRGFRLGDRIGCPTCQGERQGLGNMAERAQVLGGKLKIISSEGGGTEIAVTVPIS